MGCNVELLYEYLDNNRDAAKRLFGVVAYSGDIDTIKAVTLPAFYATYNDDLDSFIEFFTACNHATKRMIIFDHCCGDHEGKMAGIVSCSTYVGFNKFCAARCANCDNAICKYCFAVNLTNRRAGLKNKMQRMHAIMTRVKLDVLDIPAINPGIWPFFRFESFGDINNTLQVENYNLFAKVNPDINFTLWTKNPGIIQRTIDDGLQLANNLVIGLSSLYLNTPEIDKARRYSFIRFLFTVYDDDYIRDHDVEINCGAKHCITCGICYKYLHEYSGGLMIINERKK